MSIAHKAVRMAHRLRAEIAQDPDPLRERILVAGLGAIGLLTVLAFRWKFNYTAVYGSDIVDPASRKAKFFVDRLSGGARERYIHVGQSGQWLTVLQWSEKNRAFKFDIIIEATGVPEVVNDLLKVLAPNGVIMLLGLVHGKHAVSITEKEFNQIVRRNQILAGSVNAGRVDVIGGLECLSTYERAHLGILQDFITKTIRLDDPDLVTKVNGLDMRNEIKVVIEFP
jgi:threonine dehydrogenase-like Zn-dependent dehydrogenase